MSVDKALARLITEPNPESLWDLRESLMAAGYPLESRSMAVLDEFHHFLVELIASSTSREFSHFASILDLGAVGGVAIQNLIEEKESGDWWRRLLAGGLSEGLMVLAARQYVKSWEEELKATYYRVAWYLTGEFWRISQHFQADMQEKRRIRLIRQLIDPIKDANTAGVVKAALIVHYFQLLLLAHVKGLL